MIGEVVALRDRFNWYERLPLFGKRIVVTRDRRQAADLAEPLEALGAEAILLPMIEIREAADSAPLDSAIARLESYDWLIFTSVNGVRYFIERLDRSTRDLRSLKAKICAIGPATRAAVEALHLKVDRMPEEYVAESLVKAFEGEDLNWARILLPRAAVARDLVPDGTDAPRRDCGRGRGVSNSAAGRRRGTRLAKFWRSKPDWITFTSSSTVTNFMEAAGREALSRW